MGFTQKIRAKLRKSFIGDFVRGVRRAHIPRPNFDPVPGLENGKPLICVVGGSFNQDRPHSTTMISNGYARGWAKAIGPAKVADVKFLMKEIGNFHKPAIFLSIHDLSELSNDDCRRLSNFDTFIWVSVHPRKINEFEKKVLRGSCDDDIDVWLNNYGKVMRIQPKFVCNPVAKTGMEWFQGWADDGLRWETLHLAADDSLYFPEPNKEKFGNIQIAYVGGYWLEKAQAFDKYLRPFEDILWTYGYTRWPYKNYGGMINDAEERQLYSSAKIIPLIGCPLNWILNDITERYFKAPACGAFCIADENPGLREIFTEDEMLQAKSAAHFKQLVGEVLAGKVDTELWAKKAHKAITDRHLYSHRALQILKALQ